MRKRQIRVLVVEDHEPTAYLIVRAFAERSDVEWQVCVAKDGQEAVDALFKPEGSAQDMPTDFILLDWNLPKVSGREVLAMLKASTTLRTLPVVVFSSAENEDDVQSAYSAHANGFVRKPSDLESLSRIIENIESFWVNTASLTSRVSIR
jgi:CheY-like chemotaxis protein